MGVLRNMKYENGGNQRSRAAPQIRRVLSRPKNDRFWRVFYPIPPIFFAFSPFPRTYKTNFAKKIRSGLHFLAAVEAQSFCLNSGRVATAYSTDKYKYQNHENKSQLSRAIYYPPPPLHIPSPSSAPPPSQLISTDCLFCVWANMPLQIIQHISVWQRW